MANRFTDTEKWKDEWFLELETPIKMLWLYILDTCDHAGVWKVNFKLATYCIGTIMDKQSAKKALSSRVTIINEEKWHIPKFISYQYKGSLNIENKAHLGVVKALRLHGIDPSPFLAPAKPLPRGLGIGVGIGIGIGIGVGIGEEEEEKNLPEIKPLNFRNPQDFVLAGLKNPDELIKYWNETLAPKGFPHAPFSLSATNQDHFFAINKLLKSNGLSWIDYVQRVEKSKFLTTEKRGGPPSVTWFFKDTNFDDVMAGKYDNHDDGADDDIYAKIKEQA